MKNSLRLVAGLVPVIMAFSGSGLQAQQDDPSRPNVLFIISDDLQACLSSYDHRTCETPNLDRLASEGVQFDQAYCQYPVCGPARASLMSGLYPNLTRILSNTKVEGSFRGANEALADHPSIGGFLMKNGYYSARVSKIFHMGVPGGIEQGEPGGDDPDSWDWTYDVMGPETYSPGELVLLSPDRLHYGSNFAKIEVPNELEHTQTDFMATTQAIAVLENRASGTGQEGQTNLTKLKPESPFFLAVGLVRPHVPLVAPKRLFDKYPVDEMTLPEVPEGDLEDTPKPARGMKNEGRLGMSIQQQKETLAAYYASVTWMDEQVGRLLDALDRLDLRKDTIVIFCADHGYNLGEHHCWQKLSLFRDSVRVPMIISAPGYEASAGSRSGKVVELIDLYPTIADLCGLKENSPALLDGDSLTPLLKEPDAADWKKYAYTVTYKKGESLRDGRWVYNRWGQDGEELYDHEIDPEEFSNLARNPEYEGKVDEMRELLDSVREESMK